MTIYRNKNSGVLKPAFDVDSIILTESQKQKLFQNKLDRAQELLLARKITLGRTRPQQ